MQALAPSSEPAVSHAMARHRPMCATCCVIGPFEQGVVVSSGRIRVSGMLSRGRRGMILTTKSDKVWIVESEAVTDDLIGSNVPVEGVVAVMVRHRADWIGAEDHTSSFWGGYYETGWRRSQAHQ